jgi:tRNA(fMet)-specific endonuclease VapC
MIYLLDTDTVIYWMKGDKNISQKVIDSGFHAIAVSDITKAELYYGAYKSQRTDENLAAIKNMAERVSFLPFNDPAQSIF